MRDHSPVPLRDWRGELNRGSDEMTTLNHFIYARNCISVGRGVRSRYGFTSSTFGSIAGIRRIHVYKRTGEADRLLILDTTGKLWDSTNTVTPIYDDVDWVDFSCCIMYNRAYISPHNGTKGLPGEFVYVYEGSGTLRKICGAAVPTQPTPSNSGTAGNVPAGWHQFSVAFLTTTGFLTKPCTAVPLNCTGSKKVHLINVPTGPAYVIKRYILASQTITDYDAATYNPLDYEMFQIPNGQITNNVDTTIDVDFYDTDLVESADYLFDQKESINAGVYVGNMDSRLCVSGSDTEESTLWVSKKTEPESFDGGIGYLLVDPGSGGGVKNAKTKRGTWYIFKDRRQYTSLDTGGDPNSWPVNAVDKGTGTSCFGIARVLEEDGDTQDNFVYADYNGLQLFTGSIAPFPLTWKKQNIWDRINKLYFNKVQVFIDPDIKAIYIALPLDNATLPNVILYGDYSEGLSYDNIKWHTWDFAAITFSCIYMNTINATKKSEFGLGASATNKLYKYDPTVEADDNAFKNIQIDFPYVGDLKRTMGVHHFAGIRLRIRGAGTITTTIRSLDGIYTDNLGSDLLSATPGQVLTIISDHTCEKASYSIQLTSVSGWLQIEYASVFSRLQWESR